MKSTQSPVLVPLREEETYSEIIQKMEEELALNCFICSHTFNTTNRTPTIVCRRQHTYCAECVALIQRVRPNRCPECRFKIYEENIFINRSLFAICQFFPQLKAGVDSICKENQRITQENQQLAKVMQQMARNHERQMESMRRIIREQGMNLQQSEERLFTAAKQKHRVAKVSSQSKQQESFSTKVVNPVNPQERKGPNFMKARRRYTKPSASKSKQKPVINQEIFNPRIHSYHIHA